MAWAQNLTADFAIGPFAFGPVLLPAGAKTVFTDTSNAVKLWAGNGTNRFVIPNLTVEPYGSNALTGGKFLLLLSTSIGGAGLMPLWETANASQSPSTTVPGAPITFPQIAPSNPLILMETQDLWIASLVAQANPPICYGSGKVY